LAALAALATCEVKKHEPQINTYDSIRKEAVAPDTDLNHALPLASSWNASTWWNYDTGAAGFSPAWQLDEVEQGRHFLPWFNIPPPEMTAESAETAVYRAYLEAPVKEAARFRLPISFVGTEWEHYLYDDPAYFALPPAQNPNIVSLEGNVLKKLSPFGAKECWHQVGLDWGSSSLLNQIMTWYPAPPVVLFISNNEAVRLLWTEAETDRRYLDLYGYGREDDFKRQVFGEGWAERYRALIQGFREGLGSQRWRDCAKFVGFEAFGLGAFARWSEWKNYSLYIPHRIDPSPLFWEGGSPSLYIWADRGERDNNVAGLLFQAMNWVFMLDEARQFNPSFWYEFSSWDGDEVSRNAYTQLGQNLTPERYGGFVQFAMWLLRPRLVRDYRAWEQPRSAILAWFTPIVEAVDLIYRNAALELFWRSSDLVENASRPHPYQTDVPPEYANLPRMFLLTTNLDPAPPWSMQTEFPVMSLARVRGTSPQRSWLLYAYAPLGRQPEVQISVPEFGAVRVSVNLGGSYYLVDEATKKITPIGI